MLIKVKALRLHHNEFGDKYEKVKDATYEAPVLAAQSLKANGLVSYVDAKAAKAAIADAGLPSEPETAAAPQA